MELTTTDLGMKTEEWAYRRYYRLHRVTREDGLQAMVAEENDHFTVSFLGVVVAVNEMPTRHASLESALDEVRASSLTPQTKS